MRVVLERAGKKEEVEVADDRSRVTVGGRSYPVTVVAVGENRVELEIDGEKAVIENWPEHFPTPFGPVDVNGERWSVRVETGPGESVPSGVAPHEPGAASPGGPMAAAAPSTGPGGPTGDGVPVVPAMPGRVIELRVAEGDRVTKGQTLLVLEAMKMRGEVGSPADGVVRGLRVSAGANARAKEPMMWISPDPK
ncbi:MAG TPA: biotin/lipoyl-containing protein [Thermoplasmata archaeon]|nr:biotin/lipoyl-containing protein [Thermoplasmata archaeon]